MALVLIGGIKRIANVLPDCCTVYGDHLCSDQSDTDHLQYYRDPGAIVTVVKGSIQSAAVTGGAVGTLFIANAERCGKRGIFNESDLVCSDRGEQQRKTKEPVRQGTVSMTGTLLIRFIICTHDRFGNRIKPEHGR